MSDPTDYKISQVQQYRDKTWRYVNFLLILQAIGAASPPIIISLGGLIGESLSADKSLATLPVSLYNIGLALSMLPVGLLIRRFGRAKTYTIGAFCAFSGGIVAALGIIYASFFIFCLGTALAGCYGACVQSYRFAVTDYVAKPEQPQAISRVMLGGLIAAVIGPQLVIWTQNLLSTPLAASFLGQSALALTALLVLSQMGRVTAGLTLSDGDYSSKESVIAPDLAETPPRTLLDIATTFQFSSTAFAGLVSYGLMTFMMTATPMAMIHAGHDLSIATLGIQWHILAMYGPSFITGGLMRRFGKRTVCISGLLLIAAAALVSMAGSGVIHFWSGLILLGVGWNFGFIGATAMITDCYRPNERTKVQSLNDTLVFGTTAIASLMSGRLLNHVGWTELNMLVFVPVALAVIMLLWQSMLGKRVRQ
jgi:MFS family permease